MSLIQVVGSRMDLKRQSLSPVSYPLLGDKDRVKRFGMRRVASDKVKFSAPRDDNVFTKVLSRSGISNSEAEDSHSQMLERFQAENELAHSVALRISTRQSVHKRQ